MNEGSCETCGVVEKKRRLDATTNASSGQYVCMEERMDIKTMLMNMGRKGGEALRDYYHFVSMR